MFFLSLPSISSSHAHVFIISSSFIVGVNLIHSEATDSFDGVELCFAFGALGQLTSAQFRCAPVTPLRWEMSIGAAAAERILDHMFQLNGILKEWVDPLIELPLHTTLPKTKRFCIPRLFVAVICKDGKVLMIWCFCRRLNDEQRDLFKQGFKI